MQAREAGGVRKRAAPSPRGRYAQGDRIESSDDLLSYAGAEADDPGDVPEASTPGSSQKNPSRSQSAQNLQYQAQPQQTQPSPRVLSSLFQAAPAPSHTAVNSQPLPSPQHPERTSRARDKEGGEGGGRGLLTRRRVIGLVVLFLGMAMLLIGQTGMLVANEGQSRRRMGDEEDFEDDPLAHGGTDLIVLAQGSLAHRLHAMCLGDAYASLGALTLEVLWIPDHDLPHVKFSDLFTPSALKVRHWNPPNPLLASLAGQKPAPTDRPTPPDNFVQVQAVLGCCNSTAQGQKAAAGVAPDWAALGSCTPHRACSEGMAQGQTSPASAITLFVYRGNADWNAWTSPQSCELLEEMKRCMRQLEPSAAVKALVEREDLLTLSSSPGLLLQPPPPPQWRGERNTTMMCSECGGCMHAPLLLQAAAKPFLRRTMPGGNSRVDQGSPSDSQMVECYANALVRDLAFEPRKAEEERVQKFVVGSVRPEDALALHGTFQKNSAPRVLRSVQLRLLAGMGRLLGSWEGSSKSSEEEQSSREDSESQGGERVKDGNESQDKQGSDRVEEHEVERDGEKDEDKEEERVGERDRADRGREGSKRGDAASQNVDAVQRQRSRAGGEGREGEGVEEAENAEVRHENSGEKEASDRNDDGGEKEVEGEKDSDREKGREGVVGQRRILLAARRELRDKSLGSQGGQRRLQAMIQKLNATHRELKLALEVWTAEEAQEGGALERQKIAGSGSPARAVLLAQLELAGLVAISHAPSLLVAYFSPESLFVVEQSGRGVVAGVRSSDTLEKGESGALTKGTQVSTPLCLLSLSPDIGLR